jgi:cation diffusion facilitator family transporter
MKLERWGWYSIAVNVLLAALHAAIAASSGSLAVTAELIHNVVDLLAAIAVLVGLKLAARKSKAFPYGLYKVENLVAAGLAVMVFVSAYEILRHALWAEPLPVRVDAWMLAVLVATAVVPLVFSHFELRAGRSANSPALIADAKEYRVHVFTTGLAFAALAAEQLDFPLDRIAAALIVVAVIKTGWELLRDAMRVLLDASLDPDALAAIRRVIASDATVSELKWVTGRSAGRFRFVEAGVALRAAELDKAEAVMARIEHSVRTQVPHVERVLLHIETPGAPTIRYAVPLADREGTVSAHFGEAPYFAFVDVRRADGAVAERRIATNAYTNMPRAKGIRVAEWLVEEKVDAVLSHEDLRGKGPAYVLRDAGIDLVRGDARTLDAAIDACRREQRRPAGEPT